jgi:serine/threonine protein phosphatase PrpC
MKRILFVDRQMEQVEPHEIGGGRAAVFSRRKPEREGPNEDTAALFWTAPDEAVLAVADGAGGLPGGHRAAVIAVQTLQAQLRQVAPGESPRAAVLDAFERANQAILDLGTGAATTLAVAQVSGRTLRCYHAGDSALLVTGQRGKIKLITVSHAPVSYAVESGMLDERDALHHEDRNLVSNFVGSPKMSIDVGPVLELAPRDTVVLASDGVFDNLHTGEIVACVRRGCLVAVAGQLAGLCGRRMSEPRAGQPSKPDDLTFILFRPGMVRERTT